MIRDGENEVRTSNILGLLLDHGAEVADKHINMCTEHIAHCAMYSTMFLYEGGHC